MTGGLTALPPDDNLDEQSLRHEHWVTVASAADLAHKATALADRYDALPDSGDARAARRRESLARLRAAAASAQLLIASLVGPLPSQSPRREPAQSSGAGQGPADLRDAVAARRDLDAEGRDLKASERDQQARRVRDDLDPGFAHRFLAACDRDEAAGDRALAFDDRLAARDDRVRTEGQIPSLAAELRDAPRSLFERLDAGSTFHQAQGILMARSGMSAAEAFEALLLVSTKQGMSLPETAVRVAQEVPWPDAVGTPAHESVTAPDPRPR
jgi:hypothetical protein